MELFKLMGTIAIENGQAINAMDETTNHAEKSQGKIGSAFKKIGAVAAAAFAVDKIVDFGKACIETAAEMEATASQFSQVFGELEASASKNLSEIAKTVGVVENRMKGSYTKIAAFAKTSGMETAEALELADRAMIAIADSAAFYDRSLEETTESLQSFLKGNYENDAALGLSCTETTRNAAAMELFGVKFAELTEIQKQQTLMKMVEDANELSGAMGQASRESDTWTNQMGNLQQAWKDFQGVIGKPFLKLATSAVGGLADVIGGATEKLGGFIEAMSDSGERTEWFRRTLRKLVGVEFADTIIKAFGNFSNAFSEAFSAVQTVATKTIGVIKNVFGGIGNFLKKFADSVGVIVEGISEYASGIATIISGLLSGDFDKAAEGAGKVGEGFGTMIDGVKQLFKKFVEEFPVLWNTFWTVTLPNAIATLCGCEDWKELCYQWPKDWKEVEAGLEGIWDMFAPYIQQGIATLCGCKDWKDLCDQWPDSWREVWAACKLAFSDYKIWLEEEINKMFEWWEGVYEKYPWLQGLFQGWTNSDSAKAIGYDPMRYAKMDAAKGTGGSSSFAYVPTTNSVQSVSSTYSSQNIASEIRSALNNLEMSVKVDVVPDERGIFKSVQNQAKIYSKSTGQGAFA